MAPTPQATGAPGDVPASAGAAHSSTPRALRPSRGFAGVVLVFAAILSRAVVVPDGPWEQDEAIFAAGVVDLDVVAHRPHPPGFPGWMLLGKLVQMLGFGALDSLRLISAISSVALGWIVVELLQRRVGLAVAVASAAALLATPLVWVHAARGFTSTTGAACVGLAAVAWGWQLRPRDAPPPAAAGSNLTFAGWLALGLAASIRPQLAPVLLVVAAARLWSQRAHLTRDLVAAGCAAALAISTYVWVALDAGGMATYLDACRAHLLDHARVAGSGVDRFGELGVVRGLGGAAPAGALLCLALLGIALELRAAPARGVVLALVVLSVGAMVLFAHHPGFPRYAVPLAVAGWVPATLSLSALPRGLAVATGVAAGVSFSALSVPALEAMHMQPLPPVEVLQRVGAEQPPAVAFSHGQFSFARLAHLDGTLGGATLLDIRGPNSLRRMPVGSWSLAGRGLRTLPGSTVCELHARPFPEPARAMSQGRFSSAVARRDAVLLGEGHYQLERSADGAPFVWWSSQATMFPPAKASRLSLRVAVDAGNAPLPWVASCDGLPRARGELAAGERRLEIDIRSCEGPVEIDLARTFGTARDGRQLSARLLAAWAHGPGISSPALRASPGITASMTRADVRASGLHGPEAFGAARRGAWTRAEAQLDFPGEDGTVTLTMARPGHTEGTVLVDAGAGVVAFDVSSRPTDFRLPARARDGRVHVTLTSPTFIPSERSTSSTDGRTLGTILFELGWVPDAAGTSCPDDDARGIRSSP